MEWSYSPTHS